MIKRFFMFNSNFLNLPINDLNTSSAVDYYCSELWHKGYFLTLLVRHVLVLLLDKREQWNGESWELFVFFVPRKAHGVVANYLTKTHSSFGLQITNLQSVGSLATVSFS